MSVLGACQGAAIRLLGQRPESLFSTTEQFPLELAELANETAAAIAKAHDWRALATLQTLTGDGTTTAFALPADYDRMPIKAGVFSSRSACPLSPVCDLDQWLDMQITGAFGTPGFWMILGGAMQILPAMAAGETAKFYYQSRHAVAKSGGAAQATFTSDADTFRLSECLLTLGVIWRWKQLKGLEYAEDLRNFELAFSEDAGRDRGSRILAVGRPRSSDGALAYSGQLGSSNGLTVDDGTLTI